MDRQLRQDTTNWILQFHPHPAHQKHGSASLVTKKEETQTLYRNSGTNAGPNSSSGE